MRYSLIDRIAYRGDTRDPREISVKAFGISRILILWQQIGIGKEASEKYDFELDVQDGTLDPTALEAYGDRMYEMLAVTQLERDSKRYRLYLKK